MAQMRAVVAERPDGPDGLVVREVPRPEPRPGWALEKHPMEFLYGYSVAAELRPETRYDQVVEALGGHGSLVREPGELRGALERAFSSGLPSLVNVLTDPTVAYPRSANLA